MSRMRNQHKREARQMICMVCALLLLWGMACTMFVKAMNHPAERPVNGYVYMEAIGGDSYGDPQD